MNKTPNPERSMDRKLLALYMGITLVVVTAGVFMYMAVSRLYTERQQVQASRKTSEALAYSVRMIENKINAVYSQLSVDPDVIQWMAATADKPPDYFMLGEIQKKCLNLLQFHSEVESIYLYNQTVDRVLSTNHSLSGLSDFLNRAVFEPFAAGKGEVRWFRLDHEKEPDSPAVLTFVSYVPVYSERGKIAINLDEAAILSVFPEQMQGFVLLDEADRVLAHRDDDAYRAFADRRETILPALLQEGSRREGDYFYYASDRAAKGLRFVSIVPADQVLQKPSPLYVAAILLICALLALPAFRWIRRGYSQPLEAYRTRLSTNMDELKQVAVSNLLSGKQTLRQLEEKRLELDFDLTAERYAVIVLQIDDYINRLLTIREQERHFTNRLVFNAVKWMFMVDSGVCVVQPEFEKIAVLLPVGGERWDGRLGGMERTIRYIQKEVRDHFHLTVCAAISESCEGIGQVHTAYAQCLKALQYKTIYGKEAIIRYRDIPSGGQSLHPFPLERLNRLGDMLKTGDVDGIGTELDRLFDDVVGSESFSPYLVHALASNILYGFVKIVLEFRYEIGDIFQEDPFITLYSFEDLQDKKTYLRRVCQRIAEYRSDKEKGSGSLTIQTILDYIHRNFDKDISLTMLADELNMNATYLSTLIKNELGVRFLDFVNDLRIQKAVILLKETRMTVQEIAEQCGYVTVHSFIRNFKKKHTLTPNDYRNVHAARRDAEA